MDPYRPPWFAMDPAQQRQQVQRYVSTAKNFLAVGNLERCCHWQSVIEAVSIDRGAPGADILLVAATALRATEHRRFPSVAPEPYAVFGLIPTVPTARDPAVIESCYRQASELLKRTHRSHPHDPCSAAFTEAARLVADAWAFLSDPHRKAKLDSAYDALEAAEATFKAVETAATPVPAAPARSEEMPKQPIGEKPTKNAAQAAKRQSNRLRSDDNDDGNSKEYATDLDKLDSFKNVQEETNADRIKVLELQQKLSFEELETTKLAHLTAQETKEGNKLILEAKKVEKESKMMDVYNNLISQDTSSMSDEEKAERVIAMKCLRKTLFSETI